MFTIKLLEVRLEVEGSSYEQEFVRLFNEHMRKWQRLAAEERWLEHMAELERSTGDRDGGQR